MREPTQRQRLAVGASNFLWAIKPLQGPLVAVCPLGLVLGRAVRVCVCG